MVATVKVPQNNFSGKTLHRVDIAEDRTGQGISVPEGLIEKHVNIFIGCILHHIDFLEDYLPLPLYFPIIEYRMEKDIREYVYYQR